MGLTEILRSEVGKTPQKETERERQKDRQKHREGEREGAIESEKKLGLERITVAESSRELIIEKFERRKLI